VAALSRPRLLEITDLVVALDPAGGRRPVEVEQVRARLMAAGQTRAARIVASMPSRNGVLVASAVDALVIRVHCELQRLSEELQLPRRVAHWLRVWLPPLTKRGMGPVRVVDVGCGLGYVLRWLAAREVFDADVELVGVDLNPVLVARAGQLATAERLRCRFVVGDAFAPGVAVDDPDRTIVISTGFVHHLVEKDLAGFFHAHQQLAVAGFAHWDIDPSRWATVGAWVFHQARMREPVSRHDGVVSARRSHPAPVLVDAATRGATGYHVQCVDAPGWRPPLWDALRPVTGLWVGR